MTSRLCLVALVGCWRGSSSTPPPSPEPSTNVAPHDAAESFFPPSDAWTSVTMGSACPSGMGVIARIVDASVQGTQTILVAGAGAAQLIDHTWTASVSTKPARAATIVQIEQNVTRLSIALTPAIGVNRWVLFCAP